MPNLNPTPVNNSNETHPILSFFQPEEAPETRAQKLNRLLLDLSKDKSNKEFSTALRNAADAIREKAFGYNRATTKRKIVRLLKEFEICELEDFLEETRIAKKEIRDALDDLIKEKKIETGQRRRWQEAGKHYSTIYSLKK